MNLSLAADAVAEKEIGVQKDETGGEFVRIGEVAEEFGLTLRALRFYEDKGLITPKRNGVTRLYSRRDRARLKLILLGKKVGFSLRDVKHLIELYEPGGSNEVQMKAIMSKSLKQLEKLKVQRALLDEAVQELVNGINLLADRLGTPHSVAA